MTFMEQCLPFIAVVLYGAGSALLGAWLYARGRMNLSPLPAIIPPESQPKQEKPQWQPPKIKP